MFWRTSIKDMSKNHAHGMHENNHFVMVLTLLIINQSEDIHISAFLSENISLMQREKRWKITMITTVHIDICEKNSIIQTILEYIAMCWRDNEGKNNDALILRLDIINMLYVERNDINFCVVLCIPLWIM